MTEEEYRNLQVGDFIEDTTFHDCIGQVCEGKWTNVGITKTNNGEGCYIRWDDGDWSMVGMDMHTEDEIKNFIKADGYYT